MIDWLAKVLNGWLVKMLINRLVMTMIDWVVKVLISWLVKMLIVCLEMSIVGL